MWKKLCCMYKLDEVKGISAVHLYNSCYDTGNFWQQHYGFTVYRPDDNWRGEGRVRRFEIQPIIDVGKIPEFHYLPYCQVEKIVHHFEQMKLEIPRWLKCPDFYLPSRNLIFLRNEHKSKMEDISLMGTVSQLIGVDNIDKCYGYISELDHKEQQKQCYNNLLKKYKNTQIGSLTISQLRSILTKMKVNVHSKIYLKGELLQFVDDQLQNSQIKVPSWFD